MYVHWVHGCIKHQLTNEYSRKFGLFEIWATSFQNFGWTQKIVILISSCCCFKFLQNKMQCNMIFLVCFFFVKKCMKSVNFHLLYLTFSRACLESNHAMLLISDWSTSSGNLISFVLNEFVLLGNFCLFI